MSSFSKYYEYCALYKKYVDALRAQSIKLHPDKLKELSDMRKISVETLEKVGAFYIGSMTEMLLPQFIDSVASLGVISATNGKPIFEERWVFPIKDICNNITNLVGYKRDAEVRYLYGTGKYYNRSDDFYGAETLGHIYDVGWAILVEGITDRLAVLDQGFDNCLASCGTADSSIKMGQLARTKHGVVFIHDRDTAGDGTRKHWIVPRGIRLNIVTGDKDIDSYLHSPNDYAEMQSRAFEFKQVIGECEAFLRKGVCLGGSKDRYTIESATLM